MNEVTRILHAINNGDPQASQDLLPLVYDELRRLAAAKMAQESADHTLQATALVHEAYLRLVGGEDRNWDSCGHFFSAAAEAMRRILINHARDRKRLKRGGDRRKLTLDMACLAAEGPGEELLELDEALDALAAEDPFCAELVKLRFFAGMTVDNAARAMGISSRTADRYWRYSRAWLFERLNREL